MKKLLIIWVHRVTGQEFDTAVEFNIEHYNSLSATNIHYNICAGVSKQTLNVSALDVRVVNIIHL